ncbi:hypothetical protein ES705_43786 [subsurface metagenome]
MGDGDVDPGRYSGERFWFRCRATEHGGLKQHNMLWKKTKTGRVVYDRKKDRFRRSDILRIYRGVGELQWTVTTRGMDISVAFLEGLFADTAEVINITGSFGAPEAGYTAGADRGARPPRIMLIVEGY